jgi:hypothetical protein
MLFFSATSKVLLAGVGQRCLCSSFKIFSEYLRIRVPEVGRVKTREW